MRHSASGGARVLVGIAVAVFTAALAAVPAPAAQEPPPAREVDISSRFQQAIVLKAQGEYDRAIEALNRVITEFAESGDYVQLAYSHLVATYHEKGDADGANRVAREALEKFPDIRAQDVMIPSYVNTYYDTLRKEMFGRLTIREPEGCRVLLDGNHVGDTPLHLGLVRVGDYDLVLSRPGYQDHTERIRIEADRTLEKTVSLARVRGAWWWVARVGAGAAVLAATAIGVAASGDDPSPTPEPEPLSPPPAPPK